MRRRRRKDRGGCRGSTPKAFHNISIVPLWVRCPGQTYCCSQKALLPIWNMRKALSKIFSFMPMICLDFHIQGNKGGTACCTDSKEQKQTCRQEPRLAGLWSAKETLSQAGSQKGIGHKSSLNGSSTKTKSKHLEGCSFMCTLYSWVLKGKITIAHLSECIQDILLVWFASAIHGRIIK